MYTRVPFVLEGKMKLNFSIKEWCLLGVLLTAVTVPNVIGGENDFLTLAAKDPVYIPVIINFAIFFFNDMYGFIRRKKREREQGEKCEEAQNKSRFTESRFSNFKITDKPNPGTLKSYRG